MTIKAGSPFILFRNAQRQSHATSAGQLVAAVCACYRFMQCWVTELWLAETCESDLQAPLCRTGRNPFVSITLC